MILGDGATWVDRFKGFDDRLIERLVLILPACIAVLCDNPKEDEITLNLDRRFYLDPVIRRVFHHWKFQFEPSDMDENGAHFSKGKIDLAFFWSLDHEKYLAYEAKRLNVMTSTGISSLAGPYVKEGVVRFITEQYAQGLPVGFMLGYVLNGEGDELPKKIGIALSNNKEIVGLNGDLKMIGAVGPAQRFETVHQRRNNGGKILLRHTLIPCAKVTV